MIKYYVVPEDKKIIAVLQNCEYDALHKIDKMMSEFNCFISSDKYMMRRQYRVVVKCHADDTFDVERGKNIAKEKLMSRYYKDFDARIKTFYEDISKVSRQVSEYIEKSSGKTIDIACSK